ncbi:MAG TPA: peptide chain release factor aRF-1 [Candidatus Norongarragalinales archaeon]|jgi:peptide chain release factor subunit 1|nr:peptide chain release factor aRF-1 [Candidatus Norongarragalinales archaeon]
MAEPLEKTKEYFEFKKLVDEVKKFHGRGTELVTVYLSPEAPIPDTMNKLRDEYGQAANIKSKSTRQNVQDALDKIINFLKTTPKAPKNGMAIFCGNISEVEGRTDIRLFPIVPPAPLHVSFYRCESTFITAPLEEILESKGTYGLVVMDGKEATVAILKGKAVKIVKRLESTAHQKVHKGGQSAARYMRLHTEGVEFYYKRIGEAMDAFVSEKGLKGVIIGGPGPAKEGFVKMAPWNYQLKVLGVVDTGYTDEYGIREVLEKSGDIIAEQEAIIEKKLLARFLDEVVKGGLALYGIEAVRQALKEKRAERILVSEKFDESEDIIAIAESQNVPVDVVSTETPEGQQFEATFKGVGAFLRYKKQS